MSLAAFYRLGDPIGSYGVIDSSGNGNTGSLISGSNGAPAYGYAAPFLYDPSTSCDLTNGSNLLNGGIQTVDLTTQPPTTHQPIGGDSGSWTFECWLKWTGTGSGTPGQAYSFTGYFFEDHGENTQPISELVGLSLAPSDPVAVGDGLSGTDIPSGAVITAINYTDETLNFSPAAASTASGLGPFQFSSTGGAVGSTLFSCTQQSSASAISNGLDVRVGAIALGTQNTGYNRVTFGEVTGLPSAPLYTPAGYSSGATNVQDGGWHHLAFTFGTSVGSIYIDGALDTTTSTDIIQTTFYNITIGCDAGGANGWVGALANVALYSASITATQIANHYSIGQWFQQQEYGASVGGTSAGRFNKLMAVEGLPSAAMLNVPYPFRTQLYEETNPVTTTSALNYLQTMSETEPGLIFQAPNGQINAYSRQYQYLAPAASVSNGIFGDSNAASVLYHYDGPSFQLVQDDLDVWNNIQVQSGRSGSQLQQAGPAAFPLAAQSASVYGSRTLQGLTSLQFENDSDAVAVAENYLQWYANPVKRVTAISVNSWGNNGNNIPQILQRGLYDRLTVQYRGQTPGPQFSQDSLIESIAHSVSMTGGGTWNTTWQMSPYEILMTPFIFGNTAQSQLAGAASVTGSGSSWVIHPPGTAYQSGTILLTTGGGAYSGSVPYNATAAQVQASGAISPYGATCSGGPINTTAITLTGGSFGALTAYFSPSQVLTL